MENSLLMRTEASYTLNFLIYLQNIFLNQNRYDDFKFPYYPSQIAFKKEFEVEFKSLWHKFSQEIAEHHRNDMKLFYDEKDVLYQSFFENESDSLKEFNKVYESFKVWWGSFAGHFAVERAIDEKGEKLYVELGQFLSEKGIVPKKALEISLIYDDCLLDNLEVSSYFAVIPIKNFYVKYHEVVSDLQKSFYSFSA